MISIPRNCQYYLQRCREKAFGKDYVGALRMLYLAQTYADNSDDEYECLAEKLNIFDAVQADVIAVCFEAIAKQAEGDEMYVALFNNAVVHKDAEQAAYYFDLFNPSGESIPRITSTDRPQENASSREEVERLVVGTERDIMGRGKIRFVNAEEEYVHGEIEQAVAQAFLSQGKSSEHIKRLMAIQTSDPELNSQVCEVLVQCADFLKPKEAREVYRYLLVRAADIPSVICAGCISPAVTSSATLKKEYEERLIKLSERSDLDERTRRIAAYALVERRHFSRALELLKGADISFSDMFARRIYISAIVHDDEKCKEAEAMMEENLLLEEVQDRLVWEYYNFTGRDYTLKLGGNMYTAVPEDVARMFAGMQQSQMSSIMNTRFGKYMFEAIAYYVSANGVRLDESKVLQAADLFADMHPQAALKMLYNHTVSGKIKREILYRFLYMNEVFEVKKHIFLTSVDRFITTEEYGYAYRNDVIFDEEFDSWNEKVRMAASKAVAECCFYNNYEEGEMYMAAKKVNDKFRHTPGTSSVKKLYRAIVLALNPDVEDFCNITGMSEKDMPEIEALAEKYGIQIRRGGPEAD